MAKEQRLEHYLVTIPLAGGNLHGYVMTNDERTVQGAVNRMLDEIEKQKMPKSPMSMVILQTKLDTGVEVVRDSIARRVPEAAEMLAKATNFHFTAFAMAEGGDPDNDRLMELH